MTKFRKFNNNNIDIYFHLIQWPYSHLSVVSIMSIKAFFPPPVQNPAQDHLMHLMVTSPQMCLTSTIPQPLSFMILACEENRPFILQNVCCLSLSAVSSWLDSGYALLARIRHQQSCALLSVSYSWIWTSGCLVMSVCFSLALSAWSSGQDGIYFLYSKVTFCPLVTNKQYV